MSSFGQGQFGSGAFGGQDLGVPLNRGIQEFYYTRELAPRSIAIAKLATPPMAPAQLVDIYNSPYLTGTLGIWKGSGVIATQPDFLAPDLNVAAQISGDSNYLVDNYRFELTATALNSTPLFYYHLLPEDGIIAIKILDESGNIVDTDVSIVGNRVYHDLKGDLYKIRFVDSFSFVHTALLESRPAVAHNSFVNADNYTLAGRSLTVSGTGVLWIRFLEQSAYLVLPPYDTLPNAPWYCRVGYAIAPPPQEYYRQLFSPSRPWVPAFWVKGKVVDPHVIQFERAPIYFDGNDLPDILVFGSDYQIKYALDGSPTNRPSQRGAFYPWKKGLLRYDGDRPSFDPSTGRVELTVDLAPDDIVYGFYSYYEPDVVYRDLDVNPFTNPAIKNCSVEFYLKTGVDPIRSIFHRVIASGGAMIQTNDPQPFSGGEHVFATVVVGASIGPNQFTITDAREAGGGLEEAYQTIPEAENFFDLGYWDGKPYPLAGGLVVHLPSDILNKMTRDDVERKLRANLPAGVIPVVFYYTAATGEEIR